MKNSTFTSALNQNVESILNNQELFLSTFNNVLSEVMPEDLKNEMLNTSDENKRALLIHMILELATELTINK